MSSSMLYNRNGGGINSSDPSKNAQSNHSLNQQRSQGSTNGRPSSAGATRSRSGVYGYNRGSQGNTNLYAQPTPNTTAPGVYGQSYGNQRPSSAGHSRPSSAAATSLANATNIYTNQGNPINPLNINQMHISTPSNPIPNVQGVPSSSGNARPRSAGAVRRPYDGNTSSNPAANNIYAQQQPKVTNTPIYDQQYNPFTNTLSGSAGHQRPLSASATAHTTNPQHYSANYISEQWNNTAYKLQYGNNTKQQQPPTQVPPQQSTGGATLQQPNSYGSLPATAQTATNDKQRPTSSSAASKLRQALDLSHKLEGGDNKVSGAAEMQIRELAGFENDADAEGLDDFILGVEGLDAGNNPINAINAPDDEMDGKPVQDSRSHPEVSMTTPSASLELANNSSLGMGPNGVDVRNTSLDSFSEDNIQVGLTTVPNQFCTKRDALELRKLLLLSSGTRGGIVPSSSAVMDMYMVGKVVGVGSYGKVRAAWHRLTGSKIAIKTYDKAKLKDPAHWKRVHSEIKIMEQISHPRIARMYEAVETPKRMHLIMECLDGGNLCSYVKAKRRLSEDESRRIFFQILQAIEHLHALGVSHRDIKLENVLFVNDKDIKLIDFGFSTVCQPGKKLKVFCGTPSYMAPEIVRRVEYEGKPVDIWSLGILLYALLCGCFPFRAKAYPDLYRRIARGTFQIPEELSAPVKDLLRQLLTVDPEQRVTAHTALRHSWLQVQYVNAPNMDKLRQEMTILISEKPADDLDEQVISELVAFGMGRDEVIRLVLTKTHSSLATLYYLLLDVVVGRRRATGAVGKGKGVVGLNPNASNNASNPMSSNKYVQQVRKTVHSASNGGGATAATSNSNSNFANAILSGNNTNSSKMPVTSGPITVTQAVNEAAILAQQQQQQQYNYDYSNAINAAAERQEYRARPKSASQTRVSNITALMNAGSTNSNTSNANGLAQAAAVIANGGGNALPTVAGNVPQQRPLSAYAVRR